MSVSIKICGVCTPVDAAAAVAAGATHVGVIRVPGTSRWRSEAEARAVCAAAAGARRVGVYLDADPAEMVGEAASLGLDVVQLHGSEGAEVVERLKTAGLEVWKVVKPSDAAELGRLAVRYADAELLLVEGRSDRGPGGVGAGFDRDVVGDALASGAMELSVRVGLAGGLTPENVGEAVRRFGPALVDVSSGVESSPGRKDVALMRAFVRAARGEHAAEAR